MTLATACSGKSFDAATIPTLRGKSTGSGFTLACGSNSDERWYCATTAPGREALAVDRLEHLGFAAFLPLVAREVRHARRVEIVERPLFPRYIFLRFAPGGQRWRQAYGARCLRIFGATPERPTPLPPGLVERWQAEGLDKPLMRDLAPELLQAGARISITAGPFCDHAGVCLWDDGTRVAVLLSMFGTETRATLPRRMVREATNA